MAGLAAAVPGAPKAMADAADAAVTSAAAAAASRPRVDQDCANFVVDTVVHLPSKWSVPGVQPHRGIDGQQSVRKRRTRCQRLTGGQYGRPAGKVDHTGEA